MSLPIQCIKGENVKKGRKKKKSLRVGNPEGGSLDMSAVRGRKKGDRKKRRSLLMRISRACDDLQLLRVPAAVQLCAIKGCESHLSSRSESQSSPSRSFDMRLERLK